MSRPTSQTSTSTTTPGSGVSHGLAVKAATRPQTTNAGLASDVKLFVTNLRLLDFDLRHDWPGITVQTFSARTADQKQRIGGTEWALFRLFELWDPSDTAQKLQPFFPPLEPLQSLNLRAALYRSLNELKKNGVLGRDSVLRKTMLDECKGEKFYEILAIFSNVVLKKVLAARGDRQPPPIARKVATTSKLSSNQQRSLLPLAIAHKVALTNVLKRKDKKRRQYTDFEKLLNAKSDVINRRIRKSKDTPRANKHAVPQKEADAIKKQLKENWIGDPRWLQIMLQGDDVQTQDAFLQSRFDKVWRMVEIGRNLEDVVPEEGLLQNLQSRVQEQQNRLQKWRSFHDELRKEKAVPVTQTSRGPSTIAEFKFEDHLKYKLPQSKKDTTPTQRQRSTIQSEYEDLLADMNRELLRVSTSGHIQHTVSLARRRRSSSGATRSPMRNRKNTGFETVPKVPTSPTRTTRPMPHTRKAPGDDLSNVQSLRQVPIVATPTDSEATLIGHPSTLRSTAPPTHSIERHDSETSQQETEHEKTPLTSDSPEETSSSPPAAIHDTPRLARYSASPEQTPMRPSDPPIPILQPPNLTAEEVLAEQIVNSIGNATPSPVKKPQPRMSLSLVERTRMSMARTTSFPPIEESPLPQSSPPLPQPAAEPDIADPHETLLERTRRSMLSMHSKPRQSLAAREKQEKRKSSRQSLFPVNQFDTPRTRKSFEIIEETINSDPQRTPKETLFSDEVDYNRVFKSRPRIATSPVFSPALPGERGYTQEESGVGGGAGGAEHGELEAEYDEGVTGIDLDDVDQDEDEDGFTKTWADSPSRGRKGVGMRY